MVHDDDAPRPKPALKNLEPMAVAELEAYIGELEAEIRRVREAIEAKRKVRGGADALFRR